VFVTIGVGIAAVNTGNNLLARTLGLMISLILLSMVLSEIALARLRVRRTLPVRAFAGRTCLVEIGLANDKKRMPSYSLEVEDRAEDAPTDRRCYFLKVAPRGEQIAAYRRQPVRRGVLALASFRIATRYPFGLVEKTRTVLDAAELLVYPAIGPASHDALTGLLDGADAPSGRPGRGTEIGGVRDYRPGDERRDIHWRRTASLGRLAVRERERDATNELLLRIDNGRPPDAGEAWDERFEQAVSRAASLATEALARGTAVRVVARGSGSPLVHPGAAADPIWRYLALLPAVAPGVALPAAGPAERAIDLVVAAPPAGAAP
jgi:uncharacterized protein (DUF58 family)